MDFWERLNALIKQKKVTQEWVATNANIKYQTFRNWSARHIIPDAIETVAIAKVLDTSVEYLVTGNDLDDKSRLLQDKITRAVQILAE